MIDLKNPMNHIKKYYFLIIIIFFGCSNIKAQHEKDFCNETKLNKSKNNISSLRKFTSECGVVSNPFYKKAYILISNYNKTSEVVPKKIQDSKNYTNNEEFLDDDTEISQAIVLPIGIMGDISDTKKMIIYNKFLEVVSNDYDLISQEQFEKAEEEAFQQMDYEECTEDQCIKLIQEFLQVEFIYKIQLIRDENYIQTTLSFLDLDKKIVHTDFCEECKTSELIQMIKKLYEQLKKKR